MCDKKIPEIPPQITVNTGDESVVFKETNDFFQRVLEFLDYSERGAQCFTRTEYLATVSHTDAISLFMPGSDNRDLRRSDTECALLIAGSGEIVVASVIFHRNLMNFVEASFAHYLNDPRVVERARFHDPSEKEGDPL